MRCAPLFLAALVAVPAARAQSPEFIARQVSALSYSNYLAALPVQQGKARGFYYNDPVYGYAPQPDLLTARSTIQSALSAVLGGTNVSQQGVNLDQFAGLNIIGVLQGLDPAAGIYLVGAHYDSITGGGINQPGSPGADDNGSGVAGVLEAARVLSRHQFKATIIFALFDLEEAREGTSSQWGTRGSHVFARQALTAGMDIRGMICLDMIAAHRKAMETNVDVSDALPGSGGMGIELADAVNRVGVALGTGLNAVRYGAQDESDHLEFKAAGFKACMLCELDPPGNPLFHSNGDYLGNTENGHPYIDFGYASQIVAAAVDYLATAAVVVPPRQVTLTASLSTNGLFTLSFTGDPARTYELHASTNAATWEFVTNLVSTEGSFQFAEQLTQTRPARYFRAIAH